MYDINEQRRMLICGDDFYHNPGGARRPIPHSHNYCQDEYYYKVKINDSDTVAGYLIDKVSGVDGIAIVPISSSADGSYTLLFSALGGVSSRYYGEDPIIIDEETRTITFNSSYSSVIYDAVESTIDGKYLDSDYKNYIEDTYYSAFYYYNPLHDIVKDNSAAWTKGITAVTYNGSENIYIDEDNRTIYASGLAQESAFGSVSSLIEENSANWEREYKVSVDEECEEFLKATSSFEDNTVIWTLSGRDLSGTSPIHIEDGIVGINVDSDDGVASVSSLESISSTLINSSIELKNQIDYVSGYTYDVSSYISENEEFWGSNGLKPPTESGKFVFKIDETTSAWYDITNDVPKISAGEGIGINNIDNTLVISSKFNEVVSDESLSGNGYDTPLGINGNKTINLSAGEGIKFNETDDTLYISTVFSGITTDETLSGDGADEPLGINGDKIIDVSAGQGIDISVVDDTLVISSIFNGVETDETLSGNGADEPLGLNGDVTVPISAGEGIGISVVDDTLVISSKFNEVITDETLSGNGFDEPLGLNGGDIGLSAGEGINIQLVDDTLVISSIVQPKTTLIVNGFATNESEIVVTSNHISATRPYDMNGQWLFYFDKPMTTQIHIDAQFIPDSEKYIDNYDTVGFNVNGETNYTMFGFAPQTFCTLTTKTIPEMNGEIYTLPLSLNLGTSGFITAVSEPRITIQEV